MKFQLFIVATAVLATSACKTPYKATDNPVPAKDSTASVMDTSSTMNKMPVSTDSTHMSKMDSTRIDSTSRALPDSAKISSQTDSVHAKPVTDSAMNTPVLDSTKMQPATDSAKTTAAIDTASKSTGATAPAAVEAMFTKQYAGATNAVWSGYDSLAAVPIDLRMAGWKKMYAEDHLVKFDLKDESYYAWYDSNGKWIGSASPMTDITKLPVAVNTAVKNAIKSRYVGYTISQVNREFQTGKKSYEVELTKDDKKVRMLVNSAGKITQIFKYASDKTN
ncbi:MAG: hypothetical protein ACXWV8_10890 [Chitinophagaceae bacterium]